MNVYDTERMSELLGPMGFTPGATPDSADMIILNTCHIREKASEKLFSELGRFRSIKEERKQEGRQLIIAVAGCVAQGVGKEIVRRAPEVDIVVGPQNYHQLPNLVDQVQEGKRSALVHTEFPPEPKFDYLPDRTSYEGVSAFLSIQEGCDKFCTFCVVPYTRGAEFSRPVSEIIFEARSLVECGVREITLLGQNVNAYHGLKTDNAVASLSVLIEELGAVDGLARIRYTTSHPRDMDEGLVLAHKRLPFLMPYLHLPVQSGSDSILRAMNRGYTADDYLKVIDQLRDARPDIAISSDFIVGYPGETEADFKSTLRLVEKVGFAQSYSFKYSPRPGTPASESRSQIDAEVSAERLAVLQHLLDSQQRSFNRSKVGKTLEVLLEKPGRKRNQLVGRSPYLQAVHVDKTSESGDLKIGDLVHVDVIGSRKNSLAGVMIGDLQRNEVSS